MKRFYTIDDNNKDVFDVDWFKDAVNNDSLITMNSLSGGKTSSFCLFIN